MSHLAGQVMSAGNPPARDLCESVGEVSVSSNLQQRAYYILHIYAVFIGYIILHSCHTLSISVWILCCCSGSQYLPTATPTQGPPPPVRGDPPAQTYQASSPTWIRAGLPQAQALPEL